MKLPKGTYSLSIPAYGCISLFSKFNSLSGFNMFTVIFFATVVPINLSLT